MQRHLGYATDFLENVTTKLAYLDPKMPLRNSCEVAMPDLEAVLKNPDPWRTLPPWALLLKRLEIEDLIWLQAMIGLVTANMTSAERNNLMQFLHTKSDGDMGDHSGRIFDFATRLRALTAKLEVSFDVRTLGSRSDCDIVFKLADGQLAIECKAIAESREDLTNFVGLSNADQFRFTTPIKDEKRVFDAISAKLNGQQLAGLPRSALALSISMSTGASTLTGLDPQVSWALDRLARETFRLHPLVLGVFVFTHTRYEYFFPNPSANVSISAESLRDVESAFRTRLPIEFAINGYQD
jgi:hypothetical protein